MEKLLYSLGVAALGMVTVFAGLIILIAFITLLTKVTTAGGKKKTEPKAAEPKPVEIKAEAAAPVAAPAAVNDGTPSPEVVAAIAAALTAIMGEGKFAVKHIRRINNAPAWNRAGRDDQIFSRF